MRHSRLHSLPIQNSEYAAWGGRTERGWENSGQGSHRASKVQNPTNRFVDSIGSSPMRPWECLACGSPQLAHRYSQRCTQLHPPPHYLPLAGALLMVASESLCRHPVSRAGRKHSNLSLQQHCPRESKWEIVSVQPGFAEGEKADNLKIPSQGGERNVEWTYP